MCSVFACAFFIEGPTDYFKGTERIDPLFNPPRPARAAGGGSMFRRQANRVYGFEHGNAAIRSIRYCGTSDGPLPNRPAAR